jgi:hypothetical protein
MHVERSTAVRSCNYSCCGKARIITYSVSVCLYHLEPSVKCTCANIAIFGLSGSSIFFSHYHIDGAIFEKKVTECELCILIFSTNFAWHISHSQKNWARYDYKCMLIFMPSARYSCPILIKLEFSSQIFEKYLNTKLYENPSGGSWVLPCGQTDRQDEASSRFSQFCERA